MLRTPLLAALFVLGLSTAALAHPHLVAAVPPVAGKVAVSPIALRISFSEPVFANFSGIVLRDAAGHAVKTGKPAVDRADPKVLIVPLPKPLPPGVYHVEWHAVAADTHRMTGQYGFTIG